MKRGNIVVAAFRGDYGKPRPALVIQADLFNPHPSISVLQITSELRDAPAFRIAVEPATGNGLIHPSQIMIDKCQTLALGKIGRVIGELDAATLTIVNRAFAVFMGLV